MPFVSAKYGPEGFIIATDDQGAEWFLQEDSQVGDWLRYIADRGTIEPADPVPETQPEE